MEIVDESTNTPQVYVFFTHQNLAISIASLTPYIKKYDIILKHSKGDTMAEWGETTQLNHIGEQYMKVLIKQLKEKNIFEEGDKELILVDVCLMHQLYHQELEISMSEDGSVAHMKSQRYLKTRNELLKQIGVGALQRDKLKVPKKVVKKKTIFDKVEEMIKEDD